MTKDQLTKANSINSDIEYYKDAISKTKGSNVYFVPYGKEVIDEESFEPSFSFMEFTEKYREDIRMICEERIAVLEQKLSEL